MREKCPYCFGDGYLCPHCYGTGEVPTKAKYSNLNKRSKTSSKSKAKKGPGLPVPKQEFVDTAMKKLFDHWTSIVGKQLSSCIKPRRFTGKKKRRLVLFVSQNSMAQLEKQWLSKEQSEKQFFDGLKESVNQKITPHQIDSIGLEKVQVIDKDRKIDVSDVNFSSQIREPIGLEKAEHRLMSSQHLGKDLIQLVERDKRNALLAKKLAEKELASFQRIYFQPDITGRGTASGIVQKIAKEQEYLTLQAIAHDPFDAMVEVETLTSKGQRIKQLWYANERALRNSPLGMDTQRVNILSWTHPGVQVALSGGLGRSYNLGRCGYMLAKVTPRRRAKFAEVLPEISGLYEPGGSVRPHEKEAPAVGLKAVKLDMTPDQVEAFINKMNGMILVTGAPGSGKTTVGMQRIRFLYDQQELREDDLKTVSFSPNLTKIFLANQNLIDYSKDILEKDLQIPAQVVELVNKFITNYLNSVWSYKHNARPRRKELFFYEERGRQAFYGLCDSSHLKEIWLSYEFQIKERMAQAPSVDWLKVSNQGEILAESKFLANAFESYSRLSISNTPNMSRFQMDRVYLHVRKNYEKLRELLRDTSQLESFDSQFQKWLFWVYDPLDGLISHFDDNFYEGGIRIRNGIAAKVPETGILKNIREDWKNRTFGKEEEPWIAFLLRFSLPTEDNPLSRFREMPNPLAPSVTDVQRWTHVMIDEAQDLCVAEAALLSSFVHPEGAFTVAADFRQVVSPVWGMDNPEAFKIGSSLKDKDTYQSYPFAKNMRQSKQIGLFLQDFYHSIFREFAPFECNEAVEGPLPLLILCNASEFPLKIKQRINVLKRNPSIRTVALIQIDEDKTAMEQMRRALENQGVDVAPLWASYADSGKLVTSSVERIKGLEYDACFVVGMDDVEKSALKYSKNRGYVALSRPSLHLTILCEELPRSLQRINKNVLNIVR